MPPKAQTHQISTNVWRIWEDAAHTYHFQLCWCPVHADTLHGPKYLDSIAILQHTVYMTVQHATVTSCPLTCCSNSLHSPGFSLSLGCWTCCRDLTPSTQRWKNTVRVKNLCVLQDQDPTSPELSGPLYFRHDLTFWHKKTSLKGSVRQQLKITEDIALFYLT